MGTNRWTRRGAIAGAVVAALTLSACTGPAPAPPVEVPHVASVRTALPGWMLAPATEIASVGAEVGDPASGIVSAVIESRREHSVAALSQTLSVEPSTGYRVALLARILSTGETSIPAAVRVGETVVALPPLNAEWRPVELTFQTAPDQTEATVEIVADGVFAGLGIDDVTVTAESGGDNLLANGGFEEVETEPGIRNEVLVLDTATAALAVSGAGALTWQASNGAGEVVASGELEAAQPLAAISLADLGQGYFDLTVTESTGGTYRTPVAVVDRSGQEMARDLRFNVGTHVERDPYVGTVTAALDAAAAIGFAAIRNDVTWSRNERSPGQYEWRESYVQAFDEVEAHGMELLPIIAYNNKLYDGGTTVSSPEGLAAFAAYAAAVVQRFEVDAVEVFNEFNHHNQNNGACGKSAPCYLPLLEATYDAVKAVNPDIAVVSGATARYDEGWFEQLWTAGGLEFTDAMSFHPYEIVDNEPQRGAPDRIAGLVQNAIAHMSDHSDGEELPEVWVTEVGWTTKASGTALGLQGNALIRAFVSALAGGADSVYWYDLINDAPDPENHEGNFGLFYQQLPGVAAYPPKPAAMAQALLIAKLAGKDVAELDDTASGVTSVGFRSEERTVHVAWTSGEATMKVYETDVPMWVTSLDGSAILIDPLDGVVTVQITDEPVFIEEAVS